MVTEARRSFVGRLLLPEVILPVCVLVFIGVLGFRMWTALHPLVVRYKSASELAKIKPTVDSYRCLVVERSKAGSPLHAEIRQCVPSRPNEGEVEQYKVFLRSGTLTLQQTDLYIPDRVPILVTRGYWPWSSRSEAFGSGGLMAYDIYPYGDRYPYTYMKLVLPDGIEVPYHRISQGTSYVDDVQEHTGTPPTDFDKSRIWWNRDHWDMRFTDGTIYRFPEAYYAQRAAQCALVGMRDPAGNEVKFVRDKAGNLTRVSSPSGHWFEFAYDGKNRILSAKDDLGKSVSYSYDDLGRLVEVKNGGSMVWRLSYNPAGVTAVQDSRGRTILSSRYHLGRIQSLKIADVGTYEFDYLFDRGGQVVDMSVRDPTGRWVPFKF